MGGVGLCSATRRLRRGSACRRGCGEVVLCAVGAAVGVVVGAGSGFWYRFFMGRVGFFGMGSTVGLGGWLLVCYIVIFLI
jgi:hypothetical protein